MIESLRELVIVLDEKHAMPVEMRMIGEEPLMTMRFSDYAFFAADDVDLTRYAYTPPEGVVVNDLSEMMP